MNLLKSLEGEVVSSSMFENVFKNQEVHHIRAQMVTNIVSLLGCGLIYAIYMLAGDYLNTFVFVLIFSITLNTVKKTILQQIQDSLISERDQLFRYKIFIPHTTKFSLLFRGLILTYKNLTSLQRLYASISTIFRKLLDASITPYVFFIYIICWKLNLFLSIIVLDIFVWSAIDFYRALKWCFLFLVDIIKGRQPINTQKNHSNRIIEHYINSLQESSIFNSLLFCSLIMVILLILPVMILMCYRDIMTYKEDITPILSRFNLTQLGVAQYLTPEYMLKQLEGNYISPEMASQFYNLLLDYQNTTTKEDVLQVFYGDNSKKIRQMLSVCGDSFFCQSKTVVKNYQMLNSEAHLYMENGMTYMTGIWPQVQSLLSLVLAFVMSVVAGSMSFIFKFMLFQQGVMYLMNESSLKVSDIFIFNVGDEFKDKLTKNLNMHITGVFLALAQIFLFHFMLSYVVLDVIGIQLAFVISFLVAMFSLTQIVSPSVFFGLVVVGWYMAGIFVQSFDEQSNINLPSLLISVPSFFWLSGSIYSTCFNEQLGDSFWTGISVILGYISFQWKGIVYGPLLIGLIRTLGDLVKWYLTERSKIKTPQVSQLRKIVHHKEHDNGKFKGE